MMPYSFQEVRVFKVWGSLGSSWRTSGLLLKSAIRSGTLSRGEANGGGVHDICVARGRAHTHTHRYIYIYIKLKSGPRFGGFKGKKWSKFKVKKWSKVFHCFPHFIVFWGHF